LKKPGAAGLQLSAAEGGSAQSDDGHFSCANQPLSCLTSMLETHFNLPVVDHTGLTGRFDINLSWEKPDSQDQNPDTLKQALLDELGLELVAANELIDLLVIQESK